MAPQAPSNHKLPSARELPRIEPSNDRELSRARRRLVVGICALSLVVLISVCGYRWLGYPWMEAIWMVVITIATVGYGERSETNWEVMVFTIFVILFGITSATYTFGAFIQFALRGELESFWGRRKMKKEIDHLSGHVVLCGFGHSGELLAENLVKHKVNVVVVERDDVRYEAAIEEGLPTIHGDATDDEILLQAGVTRAATLVISMPNDADNVFITLTARNLSSEVQIISRAESPSTARKLKQAGASRVVLPTVSGAKMMARMITRPTTAELIELVAEAPLPHMELDELCLSEHSPLVGIDVREAEANKKHRLLVVSVKCPDGQMLFNPQGDYRFQTGDTVVLLGKHEDIALFKDQMGPSSSYQP